MKGDRKVIEHLKAVSRADVYIPQPVVAEIAYGIQRLGRSKRKRSGLGVEDWSQKIGA